MASRQREVGEAASRSGCRSCAHRLPQNRRDPPSPNTAELRLASTFTSSRRRWQKDGTCWYTWLSCSHQQSRHAVKRSSTQCYRVRFHPQTLRQQHLHLYAGQTIPHRQSGFITKRARRELRRHEGAEARWHEVKEEVDNRQCDVLSARNVEKGSCRDDPHRHAAIVNSLLSPPLPSFCSSSTLQPRRLQLLRQ